MHHNPISKSDTRAMKAICFFTFLLILANPGLASDERTETSYPTFDVKGLLFGDAYYIPSHHLDSGDGAAGLVLRRGYLTFDTDLGERTFGRLRFEVNQSGEFEEYDFEIDFKDLYLGWKLKGHTLIAGLSPTLTFDVIEDQWGLRYLMRTPMDLQGAPSRDTGVSLKGPINASETWKYRAMWGSRANFGSESSERATYSVAVNWTPAPHWNVDFYVLRESKNGPNDITAFQGYFSRVTEPLRWGVQYSHVDREEDLPLKLASGYLVRKVGEKSSLIGRIDRIFEPSPRGNNIAYIPFDPTAPATMFLGGWEYRWLSNLTLTPNVIVIDYDENDEGVTPTTDVHLRLTAYYRF